VVIIGDRFWEGNWGPRIYGKLALAWGSSFFSLGLNLSLSRWLWLWFFSMSLPL
jgi:hypothetical protein